MKTQIRSTRILFVALCALLNTMTASAATRYVWQDSPSPGPPYDTWATAAHTIQTGVDAAQLGDTVIVTNGVYSPISVTRSMTLVSVSGPAATVIDGGRATRCATLGAGAILSGFTLTNGYAPHAEGYPAQGGGVFCTSTNALLTNCVLTGNQALGDPASGGGAMGGTLYDCTLTCNYVRASDDDGTDARGAGATGSVLYGCTISSNHVTVWADHGSAEGGGAAQCILHECLLIGNSAGASGEYAYAYGGGAWSSTLHNCTLASNFRGSGASESTLQDCIVAGNWDGVGGCIVINCTLTNNYGVGAHHSTLSNCLLAGNSGHGASYSTLSNCTVSGNAGGGVEHSALTYCTLTGNWGRGASGGALTNCILTGNLGGGASGAVLQNCSLSENSAYIGGGVLGGTLYNCTLTDNSAEREGGGAYQATLYNCIVYYNTARDDGPNHFESTLNYCCTVPLPGAGVGNIDAQPQLGDCWHLTAGSSCRAAGNPAYATGLDIDSEPWISPPSIGCDEYWPGPVTGPLTVAIEAARTNAAAGYALEFQARIEGRITTSAWEFGDGVVVSNQAHTRHAWALPGAYAVTLRAYNDSNPGGVSATVAVQIVEAAVHYVTAANTNPVPPYSSWATAATNIQDAVDAAVAGALVLVSNGVYATGERDMDGASRVVVDRPITVGSVNGPEATLIVGGEWMRCVYLDANAVLSGFTLTNGHADEVGGGVRSETGGVVTNCILTGNEALGEDATGGGACGGTLHNCSLIGNAVLGSDDTAGGGAANATLYGCVLSGNWSDESGGGADDCLLYNCVLSGNSAGYGGGACYGTLYNCTLTDNSARGWGAGGACRATLYNCIVYYNKGAEAPSDPNSIDSTLNYCCTTPLPTSGIGNIANEPVFVDYAVGNFRLQSNSPCINAGNNAYVTSAQDLDGLPRIVGGTVDIGACELQSPASAISYAWLQQYGLPTDGSADFTDADGDRLNNWQEWCCRIDPTNALSVLRLLPPSSDGNDINVTWESVVGVNYFLERSTNLGASPPFLPLATNLPGQVGTTMFTDTNAAGEPPRFYRVGVTGP